MSAAVRWSDRNRRLEVRFDAIPSSQVRGELKRRGFWWDATAKVWHLARPVTLRFVRNEPITQDGFEYALRLCLDQRWLDDADAEAIRRHRQFAAVQAAEQGMEEACGIA